jgi:threonine dehydrogenase-like Zn-dependent dehydrogenase
MLAAYIDNRNLSLVELPVPVPGPGQALLRPVLAGICNTDLELLAGYYGFRGVPGHEFVAVVEEAPERPDLLGQRVVADINAGCGTCARCLGGDPRHCPGRRTIGIRDWDGALAQRLLAPTVNLRPVPVGLADELAVFAEPLAAALEIGQQVHIRAGMRVLVLGDGKLGLLAALGLRHLAPGLTLAGRHEGKLAIAGAQGVATRLVPAGGEGDLPASLGRFDLVVEATGRPQGLDLALNMVRPEGVVVAKTTSHLPTSLNLAKVVVEEITILGSRCGDLGLALDHLAQGWVDPRPLIEAFYPFTQVAEAFIHASRPGGLKVLVEFS